jgi:hypothetical protein
MLFVFLPPSVTYPLIAVLEHATMKDPTPLPFPGVTTGCLRFCRFERKRLKNAIGCRTIVRFVKPAVGCSRLHSASDLSQKSTSVRSA